MDQRCGLIRRIGGDFWGKIEAGAVHTTKETLTSLSRMLLPKKICVSAPVAMSTDFFTADGRSDEL